MKTILSWNVNGLRAVEKKGFLSWFKEASPDILCLQETKLQVDQLSEDLASVEGYTAYWKSAVRKGYSGVGVYAKKKPRSVQDLGIARFDDEGRVLILEYDEFVLLNAYFPNSQEEGARLDYKLDFCSAILSFGKKLAAEGKNFIVCGDFNIAHKPIDLAHPKANEKNPGYLPEERAWMDEFTSSGFSDSFRLFNKEASQYSWWSYRFHAREKNVGWRIDYHCVNDAFIPKVAGAAILKDVLGSDHCPVSITVNAKL